MSSGWRAFSYIMGANFQAVFLLFAAGQLRERCSTGAGWLCEWKGAFLPLALLVAAYIYFQVIRALVRIDRNKRKD